MVRRCVGISLLLRVGGRSDCDGETPVDPGIRNSETDGVMTENISQVRDKTI